MNRIPLILAIVLLLLPVLYVGSYLTQVVPSGIYLDGMPRHDGTQTFIGNYRSGHQVAVLFWPLEQIDRRVRPGAWEPEFEIEPVERPKSILRN